MEKAKHAVSSFIAKAGHHDTTVHEKTAAAVQHETIIPQQREEIHVARDREIHQDHFHTTVQPIKDQQVLPEQHHHQAKGVEHRTHDHRNAADTQQRLEAEAAKFKDQTVRAATQHTTSHGVPEVAGEHVHHHVHETIQPVIHKQTIEPHIIHTTVPIHETHLNKAQHHTGTTLPAIDLADFQKQGGSITGGHERHEHFTGQPREVGSYAVGTPGHTTHDSHHSTTKTLASTHSKPSLLDRLNPLKDADGDGKKGIMS